MEMAELLYFKEPNGSLSGCAIMRAQFATLPVDQAETETRINGTDKVVRLPASGKSKLTMLSWTKELVKDCQTKKEVAEILGKIPEEKILNRR